MKVVVGSKNPVKLKVTEDVFKAVFANEDIEFITHKAASDVPDQPIGGETKIGAENRAKNCQEVYPEADFCIGLEGGLIEEGEEYRSVAWMCVINKNSKISCAPTAGFLIPTELTRLIKSGHELGVATDIVFSSENSKQNEGTIGILTNGAIDRADYYAPALLFALLPFIKPELYTSE